MQWSEIEKQAGKAFGRAMNKKGYLSLCSIVESQLCTGQTYPITFKRQYQLRPVKRPNRPAQPQPEQFMAKHRRPNTEQTTRSLQDMTRTIPATSQRTKARCWWTLPSEANPCHQHEQNNPPDLTTKEAQ